MLNFMCLRFYVVLNNEFVCAVGLSVHVESMEAYLHVRALGDIECDTFQVEGAKYVL